jgi:hypothetical protein
MSSGFYRLSVRADGPNLDPLWRWQSPPVLPHWDDVLTPDDGKFVEEGRDMLPAKHEHYVFDIPPEMEIRDTVTSLNVRGRMRRPGEAVSPFPARVRLLYRTLPGPAGDTEYLIEPIPGVPAWQVQPPDPGDPSEPSDWEDQNTPVDLSGEHARRISNGFRLGTMELVLRHITAAANPVNAQVDHVFLDVNIRSGRANLSIAKMPRRRRLG